MTNWKKEGGKNEAVPKNLERWDIYSHECKRSKNGRMEQQNAMEYGSRKASPNVLKPRARAHTHIHTHKYIYICKRGNWNNLKIIQEKPERQTGKAQNQGITENSHTGRCTQTAVSANVKIQNV